MKNISYLIILIISCEDPPPIKAYNDSNINNTNTNNANTNNTNTNNTNTNNTNTNNANTNNANTNNANTNNANTNNANTNNANTNNANTNNNLNLPTVIQLEQECISCQEYTLRSESYYSEVKIFCAEFFDNRISPEKNINAYLFEYEYFEPTCPQGYTCTGNLPSIYGWGLDPDSYYSTSFQIKENYLRINCGSQSTTQNLSDPEIPPPTFQGARKAKIYIHQN